MTHFIGAVLVPADITIDFVRTPTKYPDMYAEGTLETEPTESLNAYLERSLHKFSEHIVVERWVSKADTIAEKRKEIQEYAEGTYAEYIADPAKYSEGVSNKRHLDYLANEFPKKLEWTDEQVYASVIEYEDKSDIREDGAIRHTYNPLSKWDWYSIGGRWETVYRKRQGEPVSKLLEELKQALVDMRDPDNIAELNSVRDYIDTVRTQFREQQARTKAWYDANPDKRTTDLGFNERAAAEGAGVEISKILTWQDVDKAEAKLRDCKAYLPWWFPFHIVVPRLVEHVNEDGEAVYDSEGNAELVEDWEWLQQGQMGWFGFKDDEMTGEVWVEKLIAELEGQDENAKLVYIDFHI